MNLMKTSARWGTAGAGLLTSVNEVAIAEASEASVATCTYSPTWDLVRVMS